MPTASSEITSQIEIHDHEILQLERVVEHLNAQRGKMRDLEDFRREIIERFEEVGFAVHVIVNETDQAGVFWFTISITDRVSGQFDPDRQVHEVTSDLLDLGTGGVIKTDKAKARALINGDRAEPERKKLWTPDGRRTARHSHGH